MVCLRNDGFYEYRLVHRLVAIHFVANPDNLPEVNHKKGKSNRSTNLEWVSRRENQTHRFLVIYKKKKSSKYIGVVWKKDRSNWHSTIIVNGIRIHLGCFNNEDDAGMAYKNALKKYGLKNRYSNHHS